LFFSTQQLTLGRTNLTHSHTRHHVATALELAIPTRARASASCTIASATTCAICIADGYEVACWRVRGTSLCHSTLCTNTVVAAGAGAHGRCHGVQHDATSRYGGCWSPACGRHGCHRRALCVEQSTCTRAISCTAAGAARGGSHGPPSTPCSIRLGVGAPPCAFIGPHTPAHAR